MTCEKRYCCDLCKDLIRDYKGGIGVKWMHGLVLKDVLVLDSEHHLCNTCCKALREMFAAMDAISHENRGMAAMGDKTDLRTHIGSYECPYTDAEAKVHLKRQLTYGSQHRTITAPDLRDPGYVVIGVKNNHG